MEFHVINLTTNLTTKIRTRSCIYKSIDNEARKKLTRLKYSNEKQ
jgi:hypothetical protein